MTAATRELIDPIIAAAGAFADFSTKRHRLQQQSDKLTELQGELIDDKAKYARLIEVEHDEAARRLLDGGSEESGENPIRRKKLAALDKKIPALAAAIPLQKEREREAMAAVEAAREALTSPVLEVLLAEQRVPAEMIRNTLATLAVPLAQLLAVDLIRDATIGDKFPTSNRQELPFAGSVIVHKFVDAIPARLHPPEIAEEKLAATARQMAAGIISKIRG